MSEVTPTTPDTDADLSWLPDARWGSAETPLPAVADDDDDDPDDELLAETPADVIAMLGFDPLDFTGGLGGDEVAWQEDKHPRAPDGKFGAGSGGGKSMIAPHSNPNTTLKKIHAQGAKALSDDADPVDFAKELIELVQGLAHPTVAGYANKVLAHFEEVHGLPSGALGKAMPKGKTPTWPKAAAKVAGKETLPKAPSGSPQYNPETTGGAASTGWPTGKHQTVIWGISNDEDLSGEEKVGAIDLYVIEHKDELSKSDHDYANQKLESIFAETEDDDEGSPDGGLHDPDDGEGDPEDGFDPDDPDPASEIKVWKPQGAHQKAMHALAMKELATPAEKVTAIEEYLEDNADETSAEDQEYGTKLAEAVDGGVNKPATATATALPEPHEASAGQKAVHAAAQTAGSMEDKAAAIKAAVKAAPSQFPTDGYALKYANEALKAIGSAQKIESVLALMGEKTAAEMAAGQKGDKPAVKPNVKPGDRAKAFEFMRPADYKGSEYGTPSEVYEAHPAKKVQRALDVMAAALKVGSATDSEAKSAVPSLAAGFWSKLDPAERSAVKGYCDSSGQCFEVNATLRPKQKSTNATAIAQAQRMDDAFEADGAVLKQPLVVRRGETVPQEEIDEWVANLAKGIHGAYQKHGFISASAATRPAFNGNVWFHIALPKGARALGAHTVSTHKGENEIMMRHGQAFTMVALEKIDGKYHAYMTAD